MRPSTIDISTYISINYINKILRNILMDEI